MTWYNERKTGQGLQRAIGNIQTGLTHVEMNTTTGKEEMTKNKYMVDACH